MTHNKTSLAIAAQRVVDLRMGLVGLLLTLGGCMSVEVPKYEVVSSDDAIEVRHYQPLVVAETKVSAEFGDAANIGFRRLANYIFGDNKTQARIAMTAPVAQTAASEEIAMTAPVTQVQVDGDFVIAFTMPADRTLATLPIPNDQSVTLRAIPAQKVAAIRFSGLWSESRYKEHLIMLQDWLRGHGIAEAGPPTWARYNPPWTLWFLRRNEILIPIN